MRGAGACGERNVLCYWRIGSGLLRLDSVDRDVQSNDLNIPQECIVVTLVLTTVNVVVLSVARKAKRIRASYGVGDIALAPWITLSTALLGAKCRQDLKNRELTIGHLR